MVYTATDAAGADVSLRFTITVGKAAGATINEITPEKVLWANGRFMVFGRSGTGYSTNGETWYTSLYTRSSWSSVPRRMHDVAEGGGNIVAIGLQRGDVFYYSTDNNPHTWNESDEPPEFRHGFVTGAPHECTSSYSRGQVIYGGDRFVATGCRTMELPLSPNIFGDVRIVTREVPVFYHSVDGRAWSKASSNPTYTTGDPLYWVSDIAYGNGRFVAVSSGVGKDYAGYYSSNGDTWTMILRNHVGGEGYSLVEYIAYGADRFVGISSGGAVISSVDGVRWAYEDSATQGGNYQFSDLVWGQDRYVCGRRMWYDSVQHRQWGNLDLNQYQGSRFPEYSLEPGGFKIRCGRSRQHII